MSDEFLIARLQKALAESAEDSSREAVSAEQILAALQGERSPEDVAALVDAAIQSGETEELLRLLPGIESAVDEALAEPARPRARRWWLGGIAAAAALIVGVLLIGPLMRQSTPPAEFRESDSLALRPLIERGTQLDRNAFTLAWSAGPEGSLYSLTVATSDLRVIHEVSMLEDTEYTVPSEALAELASGDAVLWRIDVTLPDARRASSGTFRVSVR